LLVAALILTHAFFLWRVRDRIARGDPDFTAYYTAGKMLREGRGVQLYDSTAQAEVQREFAPASDLRRGPLPYYHPPFEALLFMPLTYLPYPVAFALWNTINLGLLAGIAALLRNCLPSLREFPSWETVFAFLAFFPVFANFHQGQDAILLLLTFVLAFAALSRNADIAAGCWLGLGMFKFHFVIPLALILMFWRGRRLALGFVLAAFSGIVISIALVGWHEALQYPVYTWHIVSLPGFGRLPARLMPNILGLVSGWPVLEDAGSMRWMALAASAGLFALVAFMKDMARDARTFRLCLACAVITALSVSFNTNSYDLSLLILPLALLLDYAHTLRGPNAIEALKSLLLPALPLLISPLWFFFWLRWERTNLMAIFLLWWVFAIRRESLRSTAVAAGSSSL
jgi:Glycosyltransferase family 87